MQNRSLTFLVLLIAFISNISCTSSSTESLDPNQRINQAKNSAQNSSNPNQHQLSNNSKEPEQIEDSIPNENSSLVTDSLPQKLFAGTGFSFHRAALTLLLSIKNGENFKEKKASESISHVDSFVYSPRGQALVNLTYFSRGEKILSQLSGYFQPGKEFAELQSSHSNLRGTLYCLDNSQETCEHQYLEIEFKNLQTFVGVFIRRTNADMRFSHSQGHQSQNFNNLVKYINQSTPEYKSSRKIAYVEVSTFEVIHGITGVSVALIGKDGEIITASGSLYRNISENFINFSPLNLNTSLPSLQRYKNLVGPFSSRLAQTIEQITVLNTDEKNRILLRVRTKETTSQESWIQITLIRFGSQLESWKNLEKKFNFK